MSFIISVHVNEGIVLASDRRTTYTNTQTIDGQVIQRIGIHTTNSTDKTFICPNRAGISTCGEASLLSKPITGFIQDMIRTSIHENTPVDDMPQIVIDYFYKLSQVPNTSFTIAGYSDEEGAKIQKLYKVRLKGKVIEQIDSDSQGASWDGETEVLIRLIQPVAVKNKDGSYSDLSPSSVLWQYMTLQDAIDFARYAVETTINTMHFNNVIETVGGNVDILVITPDETKWIEKTKLN